MTTAAYLSMHSPRITIPERDNTAAALAQLRAANEKLPQLPWPATFHQTEHRIHTGDARDLFGSLTSPSTSLLPPPIQEAKKAEHRIFRDIAPRYDELLILRFRATNSGAYPFAWVSEKDTKLDYAAILTRGVPAV